MTKLILNLLTKDGGVYLPTVGSLTLGSAEDGKRVVTYSDAEGGTSIVEVIASRGNCSAEKAQKIYDKWLLEVRGEDGTVDIVADLEARLNPKPKSKPKSTKKEKKKAEKPEPKVEVEKPQPKIATQPDSNTRLIWSLGAVSIVVAIVTIIALGSSNEVEVTPLAPAVERVAESVEEKIEVEQTIETEAIEAEVVAVAMEPKVGKVNNITSSARFVNDDDARAVLKERLISSDDAPLRFRVVCGVMLSQSNAGRLILDIEQRTDLSARVYERSGGYMVTIFESEGFRPCYNFIEETASKLYDYTWIYDEKTM